VAGFPLGGGHDYWDWRGCEQAAAGTLGGLPSARDGLPKLVKSSPGRSIGRPIFGSSSLRD
jgi:hypothetical protein